MPKCIAPEPRRSLIRPRVLPLPDVQLWKTENSRRLDRPYSAGYRRAISGVVDAADVRSLGGSSLSIVRILDEGDRSKSVYLLAHPVFL